MYIIYTLYTHIINVLQIICGIYYENVCARSLYWFDRKDFDHRINQIIACIIENINIIKDKCKDNLKICSWIIHVCDEEKYANRKIIHEDCGVIHSEKNFIRKKLE